MTFSEEITTSRLEVSAEDFQILAHRVGVDAWCGYANDDAADANRMALCHEFSHGHANCAAELHAYLAFGRDVRS